MTRVDGHSTELPHAVCPGPSGGCVWAAPWSSGSRHVRGLFTRTITGGAANLAGRREELVGELAGQVEDRRGVKV